MKCVRSVLCICIQNIRKWTYDYRVWIIAALLFFVCFDNSASLGELARFYGVRSTLWYFPFAYMSFHIKIIVTFPLVLLMCSAPFADANNLFIITRAGRTKWICGQLIYITLASAIYYLFIFACSVVTAMPYASFQMNGEVCCLPLPITIR